MYGPRYYYEVSGCLALLTARGVVTGAEATAGTLWSISRRRAHPSTGPFFAALIFFLSVGNVFANLPREVDAHRGYNFVNGTRQAIVRASGVRRAIVFVPTANPTDWWDYGSVFSANDPLLKNDIIYARDLGPSVDQRTADASPDRTPYVLVGEQLFRMRP